MLVTLWCEGVTHMNFDHRKVKRLWISKFLPLKSLTFHLGNIRISSQLPPRPNSPSTPQKLNRQLNTKDFSPEYKNGSSRTRKKISSFRSFYPLIQLSEGRRDKREKGRKFFEKFLAHTQIQQNFLIEFSNYQLKAVAQIVNFEHFIIRN